MPSRCCEFVDSRLRRSPPDRASAVPMDKPGKTQCVSPTLPTGRRLPHKLHSTPQQHGMILISGNGEISSRLHAFSLFLPESCPINRDDRTQKKRPPSFDIIYGVSTLHRRDWGFPITPCDKHVLRRHAFAQHLQYCLSRMPEKIG